MSDATDVCLFRIRFWTAPGLLDTRVRVFDLMRPPQLGGFSGLGRRSVAVALENPMMVVQVLELKQRPPQFLYGGERAHPQEILLQDADEPLTDSQGASQSIVKPLGAARVGPEEEVVNTDPGRRRVCRRGISTTAGGCSAPSPSGLRTFHREPRVSGFCASSGFIQQDPSTPSESAENTARLAFVRVTRWSRFGLVHMECMTI